jgi:hypothetical protein
MSPMTPSNDVTITMTMMTQCGQTVFLAAVVEKKLTEELYLSVFNCQ